LYNAVTPAGMRLLSSDRPVVSASVQGLSRPRLGRAGNDFVIAYGRRDTSGAQPAAQAAIVLVAPLNGAPVGASANGMSTAGASAPPEIGGVVVSADGAKIGVISRAAGLTVQAATVDAFSAVPALTMSGAPSQLATSRNCGIAWAPDRFIAGAVTDATSAGGTLLELSDTNLTVGPGYPFTAGADSPTIGAQGATMSIAGAGDRVAVAWVDSQSGTREIWIATISLANHARLAVVKVSTESPTTKGYPHVVYDGAAFALTWIEGDGTSTSRIRLARLDVNLLPIASPTNVSAVGAVTIADIDITAAGANAYGIVAAGANTTQLLYYVTCN
jgi:hypothetical protein